MGRLFYYVVQWTWGLPANLIGLLVFIFTYWNAYSTKPYHYALATALPGSFGGFSLGMWIFYGQNCESVLPHEYGHGRQVLLFSGLGYLLFFALPSVVRYWYREWVYKTDKEKYKSLPDYDSVYFEGLATKWGNEAVSGKFWYM